MKKTISLLLVFAVLSLSSCTFLFWTTDRPAASLQDAVTFEETDGVKSAVYGGCRYLSAKEQPNIAAKVTKRSSLTKKWVLIGWTERFMGYRMVQALSYDRPDFFLYDGKELYYREDFDLFSEVFALDVGEESNDEGIELSRMIGEETDIEKFAAEELVTVTLYDKNYPILTLCLNVFLQDETWYFYAEYGTFYTVSSAFKTYLIKNHYIVDQNHI